MSPPAVQPAVQPDDWPSLKTFSGSDLRVFWHDAYGLVLGPGFAVQPAPSTPPPRAVPITMTLALRSFPA